MSDARLEARLADLGRHLELPPAPGVSARVRARVAAPRAARRLRPALAIPLVLLVAAFGGLAASPSARSTVLRWLGIEGVTIERVPETPRAPAPAAEPLGTPTTLAGARRQVGFRPLVPRDAALGRPAGVFVDGERLTLRYPGALLSEFPGRVRAEFVHKTAGPQTRIEPVTVDGGRGFWISGAPHVLVFEAPSGEIRESLPRLAANTLVWRRGRLTLRLEADVPKQRALEIARSTHEGSTP